MRFVLRLLRWVRMIKRRLFKGEAPHWAKDVYDLVKVPIEALEKITEVAPTLFVVWLNPVHFFDRLPLYLTKRKSGANWPFKTPVGLAGQIVGLVLAGLGACKLLRLSDLHTYFATLGGIVVGVLTLPLSIPIVCLVLLPLYYCVAVTNYLEDQFKVVSIWLRIPLHWRSYSGVGTPRYWWSLFYCFGYLISIAPIILVPGLLAIGLAYHYVEKNFPGFGRFIYWLDLLTVIAIALIARVAIYPYAAVLISASNKSSELMVRCEHWELEKAVELLEDFMKRSHVLTASLHSQGDISKFSDAKAMFDTFLRFVVIEYGAAQKRCVHVHYARDEAGRVDQTVKSRLGYLPWEKLASQVAATPLSEMDRRDFGAVLTSICGSGASKYFQEVAINSQTGFVEDFVDAIDDAFSGIWALRNSTEDLHEHYEDALENCLEVGIPTAWVKIDPTWEQLRVRVDALRLDAFDEALRSVGRNLERYRRTHGAVQAIMALRRGTFPETHGHPQSSAPPVTLD